MDNANSNNGKKGIDGTHCGYDIRIVFAILLPSSSSLLPEPNHYRDIKQILLRVAQQSI